MKQIVEAGSTLLVDGPACVKIVSGKVEVFGFQLKAEQQTVIREGKRLPFFAVEKADFNVSLGANASIEEAAGNTIPASWAESVEALTSIQKKPVTVMLIGKADSGKSSYCTYLTNKLVNLKNKVAVLDGDIGQSDIGPPCTVAYAIAVKPVTELYELKLSNAFFVGVTSPIQAIDKALEGLTLMKTEILEKNPDFILINTDGWIEDELAIKYKMQLVEKLKPDIVVGVQVENELRPLFASMDETTTLMVDSSSSIKERNQEKRKKLREICYAKYLKNAKIRAYFMNYIEVLDRINLPKVPGEEKGLLVGLKNSRQRFIGIGVVTEVNRNKKVLKVFTPVKSKPGCIIIGKLKLDENLKEA